MQTQTLKIPSVEHWLIEFPDTKKGHKRADKLMLGRPKTCAYCYWNQHSTKTENRSCQYPAPLKTRVLNNNPRTALCMCWRIAPDAEDRMDGFNTWV